MRVSSGGNVSPSLRSPRTICPRMLAAMSSAVLGARTTCPIILAGSDMVVLSQHDHLWCHTTIGRHPLTWCDVDVPSLTLPEEPPHRPTARRRQRDLAGGPPPASL